MPDIRPANEFIKCGIARWRTLAGLGSLFRRGGRAAPESRWDALRGARGMLGQSPSLSRVDRPGFINTLADFTGRQPGFGDIPGFDLYNMKRTIQPNLPRHSSVTPDSIFQNLGRDVPMR